MSVLFECRDSVVWSPSPRVARLFVAQVRSLETAFETSSGISDVTNDEVALDADLLRAFVLLLGDHLADSKSATLASLVGGLFALSWGLLTASTPDVARPPWPDPVRRLARRGERLINGTGNPPPVFQGLDTEHAQ